MRRRVLRSLSWEPCESMDTERRLRLGGASRLRRLGDGEREGERVVEIVEMESADEVDEERERLREVRSRSCSFFLRISSATPFLVHGQR